MWTTHASLRFLLRKLNPHSHLHSCNSFFSYDMAGWGWCSTSRSRHTLTYIIQRVNLSWACELRTQVWVKKNSIKCWPKKMTKDNNTETVDDHVVAVLHCHRVLTTLILSLTPHMVQFQRAAQHKKHLQGYGFDLWLLWLLWKHVTSQ